MSYICQLGDGNMLSENNGNLSVEYTGYPYPDCEYNGINGQLEILRNFGVVVDACTNFNEDIKELLNSNVSTVEDLVAGIKKLSSNKFGYNYDSIIQEIVDYTSSTASLEDIKQLFIQYNVHPVSFKQYNGVGLNKEHYGALLMFEERSLDSNFFRNLINCLNYDEHCLSVYNAGFSYSMYHAENAYIYFNVLTSFGDLLCSESSTPVNAPIIGIYDEDEDRVFDVFGDENTDDNLDTNSSGYFIDCKCRKYSFNSAPSKQLVSIEDYIEVCNDSLIIDEIYEKYNGIFDDIDEFMNYISNNFSTEYNMSYSYYVDDVINDED